MARTGGSGWGPAHEGHRARRRERHPTLPDLLKAEILGERVRQGLYPRVVPAGILDLCRCR
ncbi:MAG: hypothetical protein GX882_05665 [Methanomicrobiales archaeon]|nr:hypothetical protein [Methanomicrobiales archaeon]